MSIIQEGANAGQQELTLEQKKERTKIRIARKSYETFQGLVGTYVELKQTVWENPQGLTPQQVFDALGTNGGELFSLSTLLVTTVNTVIPGTLTDTHPYEFTINPDGTVTVGNPV